MNKGKKYIHLALQGGGAHGAFAWGVIDKFLEDGRLHLDGICATSAGSMNAVVLVNGLIKGGNDGARQALYDFWFEVSKRSGQNSNLTKNPFHLSIKQIAYNFLDAMTHLISPYQFNPFNYNVLKDILLEQVDFERIKRNKIHNLFLTATKVQSGRVKVFTNRDMCVDVVLASACLPYLFHSVKVEDQYYWDGGYSGNPAIFPLFYHEDRKTNDVVIVHINPIKRSKLPTKASEIMNRINEITFNSSLLKEFRAIAFVNKLLDEKWIKDEHKHKLKKILVHSVRADEALQAFDVATKMNTEWEFLTYLRDLGRVEADRWLKYNYDAVNKKSSVDLQTSFLHDDGKIG
jgi:NTE family protein